MIEGFSKFAVLYLAPLLMLTALFLSTFSFFAPTAMLHDQVALLTVTPSTALTNPQATASDGPSVFFGLLGSCSRPTNAGTITCTDSSITPLYDTSVLPSAVSNDMLSAPPSTAPAFLAVAISFSFIFFVAYTLLSFRHKLPGGFAGKLDKPIIARLTAWVGVFGFMIGISAVVIVRIWFEKAIEDFNKSIIAQGKNAPELVASASNGFTMLWIAYSFYAAPLIASLAKINVAAGGGKDFS